MKNVFYWLRIVLLVNNLELARIIDGNNSQLVVPENIYSHSTEVMQIL